MKTDKSLINYHGKSQTEYLFDLLTPFCSSVYISAANAQVAPAREDMPLIYDQFLDFGPTAGILSAMNTCPEAAWLVIACDLPFIDAETLNHLIENRDHFKFATAYISTSDDFPEPLCSIYEPKSKIRLFQFLGLGYDCPRKVLINSEVKLLQQKNKLSLTNVNNPEEYQSALDYFKQKEENK
jgi:molybdopterin-guanine dinucleotide biosynthesis protein A